MKKLVRSLRALCVLGFATLALTTGLTPGCASGGEGEEDGRITPDASAGTAGTAGSAGSAGSGAHGGSGGSSGTGGTAGTSGASGSAGVGGGAGSSGTGGAAGSAGASGAAGWAGAAGAGGIGDAGVDAEDCTQRVEVCNGIDDNCNGAIDESDPQAGAVCTVSGRQGPCAAGEWRCLAGTLTCVQTYQPRVEECNGIDDNCNGSVDEQNPGGNQRCNTGLEGICAVGTTACETGAIQCHQNVQPATEVCNGLDDDCDGTPDNGFSGAGDPCTVPNVQGPCAVGKRNCLTGQDGCTQTVFPASETCNGVDDNCDGVVDDPSALVGLPCDTGLQGVCAAGKTTCASGVAGCQAERQPSAETCNGLDDDCDGVVDNVANIGGECASKNPSASQVSAWACVTGFCAVTACNPNYSNCDGAPGNGCETNLLITPTDCGRCGLACNDTHGTAFCSGGQCGIACSSGYQNCDNNANNGCEIATGSDLSNCGGCGVQCSNANGSTTCTAGACVPVCSGIFANCDGNAVNGCETNTDTSTAHCGGCGIGCANDHGTTSCNLGTCAPLCGAGYSNCDGNLRNGCETSTASDVNNCGSCNVKCVNANGTVACTNGVCAPLCSAGSGDCDSNPNNGCETNTNTNIMNCGGCGILCTNPNGTTSCSGGTCTPSCAPNFLNCDGFNNNGCETDRRTDLDHCGACGQACTNAHGTTACSGSQCQPTCDGGWGNCDGDRFNGCEQNLANSVAHCGGCGQACTNAHGTTACTGGSCVPTCANGWSDCDGVAANGCETNTNSDNSNCGSCGELCSNPGGSASCSGGICQVGCNAGRADCDGNPNNGCETNTTNNASHCGGCNNACLNAHGSTTCSGSQCLPTCSLGWGNCDGDGNNGCETNVQSSVAHCGGCNLGCTNAHGSTACSNGVCQPTCATGFADCDGNPRNGCETDIRTSTGNCGGCGLACTNANGGTSCVNGACSPVCSAGAGNCDGNANNGCETNLNNNTSHCGSCGNGCTNSHGGTACVAGNCSPSCAAPWAVCGGDPDDGCNVNTSSNVNHCGSCGNVCGPKANTAGVACATSACSITACASGYTNPNGIYGDGCECAVDSVPDSCSAASNNTVAIDASVDLTGNLQPAPTDVDWYQITFTQSNTCSYGPKLVLTGDPNARMQVYTSCGSGAGSGGMACLAAEGGISSKAGGITSWDFNFQGSGCGDNLTCDPTPGAGAFWVGAPPAGMPATLWVKVFSTGSSATCQPYKLTASN